METASSGERRPLVSIIMATYNRSAMLRLSLQSVLWQDVADFEVWVVGDGCTDDTEAVIAAFADPRVHWLNLSRNSRSQAAPNNAGIQRARGQYIAYLGHDDLWFPWHLSTLLRCITVNRATWYTRAVPRLTPLGWRAGYGAPGPGVTYANHFVPPSTWLYHAAMAHVCGPWRDPDTLAWAVTLITCAG